MGCPWGEGQHGGSGSRSIDDSVLLKNMEICMYLFRKQLNRLCYLSFE